MGLKLKIVPAENSNLNIGQLPTTYDGVYDFSGEVGYVSFIDNLDTPAGDNTLGCQGNVYKWKMWMDTDSGWNNTIIQSDVSGILPEYMDLRILMRDSSLYIMAATNEGKVFDMTGLDNQILNCELTTGYWEDPWDGTAYIPDFKINGNSMPYTLFPGIGSSGVGGFYIGLGYISFGGIDVSLRIFGPGTMWDFSIETSLGVLTHQYDGYPNGNTLAAWEDNIGNIDAQEVSGNLTTRNITGIDTENQPLGQKLLIAPPPIPVPDAPTLYRPLDGSVLGTIDPSLAWNSVSGADTYWVQLDDASDFSSMTYDVSGLAGLYYDVSSLDTSTAYYWRAAATNTSGTSDWSEKRVFYTPQASPFPISNLEAYWNFDESSGTITDQTANDNNAGTLSGITYGQTGVINDAVSITSSGYIQGASDTIGTAVFSISVWFKTPDVGVGDSVYIFDIADDTWVSGYNVFIPSGGNISLRIYESGGADGATTIGGGWDDDNWHHLVITHNGGTFASGAAKFYVDGELKSATDSGSRIPSSNVGDSFRIGAWKIFDDSGLNGEIDEMGVWSTVLSAADVSILWNEGNGLAYPGI